MGALSDVLEMTKNADVGILIETGVPFYTRFGLLPTFENTEVMDEKTELPFVSLGRVVMLKGMGLALGKFDEFTVCYASSRPVRRKMVSIEFVQTFTEARRAHDDAFAALTSYFDGIHRSTEGIKAISETKIAHAFGVRRGIGR